MTRPVNDDGPDLIEAKLVPPSTWGAARPVRVTHVGAMSGLVWGLIAVGIVKLLGGEPFQLVATSLLVSPVIGIGASRAMWPLRTHSLLIRIVASGLLLYVAAALYGFAAYFVATFGPHLGATGIIERVHIALIGAATFPYGMSLTGIVAVLWPLAFANCTMVWRIHMEGQ